MQKRVVVLFLVGLLVEHSLCMENDARTLPETAEVVSSARLVKVKFVNNALPTRDTDEIDLHARRSLSDTLKGPVHLAQFVDRARQQDKQEKQADPLEPESKKPKPSLKIKIKLQKPSQPILNPDPQDSPPTLNIRAAQADEPVARSHSFSDLQFLFDDIDLKLSASTERRFDLLLAQLSPIMFTTFYFVHFDHRLERHITFCSDNRVELVRNCLSYLLSDPTAFECMDMCDKLQQQFPKQLVKQSGLEYSLECVEQGCGHRELQPTVDQVVLKIVEHYMLMHQREAAWYAQINNRIAESFDQAVALLQREKE